MARKPQKLLNTQQVGEIGAPNHGASPWKQILFLYLITVMMYVVGSGIMSLVALYAQQLGGTSTQIGMSLAVAFAALSLSTLCAGWFSNRYNNRKGFISLAVGLSVPTAYLLGHSSNIWHMTIGITILWFLFGIVTTMANILTGLYADHKHRGTIFGIIGAALPTGQFIGALFAGPIVERWGYPAMFTAAAVVYGVIVLLSSFLVDIKIVRNIEEKISATRTEQPASKFLLILMTTSVFAFSISFMTNMARPMTMELKQFGPTAISSVSAVSGLAILPLQLLVGWLSDRIGRRPALFIGYLLPAIGIAMMIPASMLWHFWLAQSLVAVVNITQSVGSSIIADTVPQEQLSTSLSHFNATVWIGAVVGFVGTGLLIQAMGFIGTFGVGAGVMVLALFLVVYVTNSRSSAINLDKGFA